MRLRLMSRLFKGVSPVESLEWRGVAGRAPLVATLSAIEGAISMGSWKTSRSRACWRLAAPWDTLPGSLRVRYNDGRGRSATYLDDREKETCRHADC